MSDSASPRKLIFPALGLAFTALGAAYGGPNVGALAGTIASSLSWLGGVMGNRSDALLFGEPKDASTDDIFNSRHLRALLKRTIEVIAQQTHRARSSSVGTATDILRDGAVILSQAFEAELDDPHSPFQVLDESQVPDILNSFACEQGDVLFLTPELWLMFVDRHLAPHANTVTKHIELWQSERIDLSHAFHTQFGTALWNLVKENAATDRRAFAAVQLLYFSRILDAVENQPQAPDTSLIFATVQELIDGLDDKQSRWFQRLWQQQEQHHGSDTKAHQKTQLLLQLVLKRLDALTTRPVAVHRSRHPLPPLPTSFVGRQNELALLRSQFDKRNFLIGLRGMGGIGKTSLGLALAHEWASNFPDAQIFLDGQGTSERSPSGLDLQSRVINVIQPDAKIPDDPTLIAHLYVQVLGDKKALIFLDNAKDAAQAKALMPPQGVAMIFTSRETIDLSLAFIHQVRAMHTDDAMDLLRSRYSALSEEHAIELCKLCDGLPLALAIAESHLYLDALDHNGVTNVDAFLDQLRIARLDVLDEAAPYAAFDSMSTMLSLSETRRCLRK